MNEEKDSIKQFLNKEALGEKQEVKEGSIENQKEQKEVFEGSLEKQIIEEKLGEDLKKMEEAPEKFENQIQDERKQIDQIREEGKLSRLLTIAEEKGAHFAVEVAKGMDDPFILDALHDLLVQKGIYEKKIK